MFKVGDKVTRKGTIVWEVAEVSTAREVFSSELAILGAGGPDTVLYRLRNTATGKVNRNVWWNASELKAI